MIKVIVFDFDGVLVDSNRLKHEAWFKLFPPKEVSNALIADVLVKFKATRYDILREIFRRLGKSEGEIESLVARYADKYNEIVQSGISSMGLNAGAEKTLLDLKAKFSLYLNSATPEDALAQTINRLEIRNYFKKIYGQSEPRSKEINLQKIINEENVLPSEVLVVGDGQDDLGAAKALGCLFIGVTNNWNKWHGEEFLTVSNLPELMDSIKKL